MAEDLGTIPTAADILREEFLARKKRNPKYSLRAFAGFLGCSAAQLSHILRGSKRVSETLERRFVHALRLAGERRRLFETVARFERAETGDDRGALQETLRDLCMAGGKSLVLKADVFQLMANWHHQAIVELTHVQDFRSDPAWIATALGISRLEAEVAVERLLRLGLLEHTGRGLRSASPDGFQVEEVPSRAVRSLHRTMLARAVRALDEQPVHERDFTTITMAVDPARLPEARRCIRRFHQEIQKCLEVGVRTRLYQVGIQLFRLDEGAALPRRAGR